MSKDKKDSKKIVYSEPKGYFSKEDLEILKKGKVKKEESDKEKKK